MAHDADTWNATRIRMSLTTAGFGTVNEPDQVDFAVPFEDNTSLSLGFRNSEIFVARVMPSGTVSAFVTFRGLPLDMVAAAVVAIAKEA